MVFSSLVFLCVFLPTVLVLYRICPGRCRNLLLMVVSLVFYAWGEPRYILIMLFSTVFDYCNGRLIERFEGQARVRKGILILSIVGNLGILCFFKYTDLLLDSWNRLTASQVGLLELALPVGISFYTFQTMSYTIDVYRGKVKAQHNIVSFGMYVCMFPQLIAGPIVRYQYIEAQLGERRITEAMWVHGMQRFLTGLGKKVIFANQIGMLWEEISTGNLAQLSLAGAWLGALAYTLQIYFDFSGYSDMAIGLGKMFGFRFPENFRHPYQSKSITEFWRRWHITLSSWFREYVYIPLGGNRKGVPRQIFNLFVVWLLTGIWHGASWNFALWGFYFFLLLLFEKLWLLKRLQALPAVFGHIYAKFFIIMGWVIFAVEDFSDMGRYLRAMFGFGGAWIDQSIVYELHSYGLLLIIMLVAATKFPRYLVRGIELYMIRIDSEAAQRNSKKIRLVASGLYSIFVLLISMAMLIQGSYNPFLYFRF